MPEHALPSDFHTGWSSHGVSTRKMKFRQDIQKRKVQELAWKLWNDHLKEAHAKPREALVRLENAARTIEVSILLCCTFLKYYCYRALFDTLKLRATSNIGM